MVTVILTTNKQKPWKTGRGYCNLLTTHLTIEYLKLSLSQTVFCFNIVSMHYIFEMPRIYHMQLHCLPLCRRDGGGDRGPGEKGAGGVREAGEEGAGSGIPKVAESGRKKEKLCNIAQYFAIEKMQRGGSEKIQGGNRD